METSYETMKTIIFVLTLICLTFAAPEFPVLVSRRKTNLNPSPRTVGGNIAEPHSIPYQALLEFYTETYGWYCGGSVISQHYVLTSATCANNTLEVLVTLGAHNAFITETTQINVYSTDIIVHEHFGEIYGWLNDIAVVKLPRTIDYTDAIQPVTLPKRADIDTVYLGVVGRIAGWGSDDGFDDRIFDLLRYIDTTVISSLDEDCREYIPPGSMFCTSGEFNDMYVGPCNGDNGSGFVSDGVLIGIVSFNIYCLEGYPGFHTRVVNFLDWIGDNTDVIIN
ncbi:brachyurin-like [Zophobas morio]|uniref:brachyurin-like n=1 Tax=Zophobas morio TaxID=2755281 RepID=UPI0030837241